MIISQIKLLKVWKNGTPFVTTIDGKLKSLIKEKIMAYIFLIKKILI